jgi:transposase
MAYNFVKVNREQPYLMPPSVRDWLPKKDMVWFVLDAVEQMDMKAFYERYRSDGWGHPAFEPKMMATLLMYAYSMGERSSRRIERLCERDIAFRVVTANQKPDHTVIARFRQAHEKALEGLFIEVLKLCQKAGLVKVGVVALDGTKVKANAALAANRTYEHIEGEVKKMLQEAQAKDAEEDALYGNRRRGDELPEELTDRQSRRARLKACKEQMEREAQEAAAEQTQKIEARQAEEAASGQKKRGRKPKEPDPTPPEQTKANVTDPQSRIMKTRTGFVQGYNAQAVVGEGQVIVAAEVTQQETDVHQLHPMLEKAQENLKAVGDPQTIGAALSDAGYWSEANVLAAEPETPELFIATTKDWKQRKAMREQPPPRGRLPQAMSARDRMERKLLTRRGRALYTMRAQMIEPVFGQVKEVRGCDRFQRRGHSAAQSEWKLICATHNLLKLWRSGKARWN